MKTCSTCKVEKDVTEFGESKERKDKLQSQCKSCRKQYQLDNKEKIKQYQLDNKERIKQISKQYYLDNKEKLNEHQKQYRLDNKERIKQYYLDNKEKLNEHQKQWYLDNKEKAKQYYLGNKDKKNEYYRNRKETDPLYKLRCNIGGLIYHSIKSQGYKKNTKTANILGCDFETFKLHLEKQFTKGMSWDNQGKWHLDHIYPVSLAKDEAHLIELNHYTNFQPLWAIDNIKKGNKIQEKQLFLI